MIEKAAPILNEVYCIDLNDVGKLTQILLGKKFEAIIAADVLEHLVNPWAVLSVLFEHLTENGRIILSIPNIGHWATITHFLRRSWPLNDRGIYDSTHLRWFMYKDIEKLVPNNANYRIAQRNFRFFENGKYGQLSRIVECTLARIPWFKEFFVFQYIIVITR